MNLLTTYTHNSEPQAITIHKSPQLPLSLFPTCCVFTSRSLAMAPNSGDSSVSRTQVLSSQPPVQNQNELEYARNPLVITSRHGPHRKHSSSTVVCMLQVLPSNTRCLQSHRLATGLHTTIYRKRYERKWPWLNLK
jgi:hypothetical protein